MIKIRHKLKCGYKFVEFPENVDMWTGLQDKNGVDVYTGDRLYIGDLFLGEVVFENGAFRITDQDSNDANSVINAQRAKNLEVKK